MTYISRKNGFFNAAGIDFLYKPEFDPAFLHFNNLVIIIQHRRLGHALKSRCKAKVVTLWRFIPTIYNPRVLKLCNLIVGKQS